MIEGSRIKAKLAEIGLSQAELARRVGIRQSTINGLISGAQRTSGHLHLIARELGTSPEYLTGESDEPDSGRVVIAQPSAPDDMVEIQKLDLSLSMGPGTLIDDFVESEIVKFDLAMVRGITRTPSNRLRLVTGIGDSMRPTLDWGDLIMIDLNDRGMSKQDGIYWIDLFGASGIKRLRTVSKGRIMVISDNPALDNQEVDAEDLRIEGRAIWKANGL